MSPPEILRLSFPDLGALEREIASNIRYGRIFTGEVLAAPVLTEGVLVIVHPVDGRELRLQAQIVMVNLEGPMRGTGLALRSFGPSEVEQVEAFARASPGRAAGARAAAAGRTAPVVHASAKPAAVAPPSAADDDWSDLAESPPPVRPRAPSAPIRPRVTTQKRFAAVAREENLSAEPRVIATYPRAATAQVRPASTAGMPRVDPRASEDDDRSQVVPTADTRATVVPPIAPAPNLEDAPHADERATPTVIPPRASVPPASWGVGSSTARDDDDWSGVAPDAEPVRAAIGSTAQDDGDGSAVAPEPEPEPIAAAPAGIGGPAHDDDGSAVAPELEPAAAAPPLGNTTRDDDDWSGVAPEPEPAAAAPPLGNTSRDDDDWSGVAPEREAEHELEQEHELVHEEEHELVHEEGHEHELQQDNQQEQEHEHAHEPEAAGEPAARAREVQSSNRQERLRTLNVVEQLKIARRGELSDRVIIERLYGKTVWEALLQNPRITLPEVARIARKGTVPRPLIEIILENASWLKAPNIRRALLGNPKLPADGIQKLLRLTPKHELKVIDKTTAYPMAVRDAARKLLRES